MTAAPNGYWASTLRNRMTRRRALQASGSAAAAAAFLAACGGGSSSDAPAKDVSSLVVKPEDTLAKAERGGIIPLSIDSDAPGFDGITQPTNRTAGENLFAYAQLLQFKVFNAAKGETNPTSETVGDGAESFEISPDKLTLTFKIRPDGKLDPRPPTNGRVLDSSDVVYAWDRFKASHRSRAQLSNEVNKAAPVISVTATDARTVVFKLSYPAASLPAALASNNVLLFPKERESGFDPKQDMRGSGPWMLTKYTPSVGFEYQKNPGYWDAKNRPLADGFNRPIITEYAAGLAQFKAGRIASYLVRQEDVLQAKEDQPNLVMQIEPYYALSGGGMVFFDFRPGSIWQDERLRQAVSMMLDRDLFLETVGNKEKLVKSGVPFESRWHNHIAAGMNDFWLDPQGNEIGEAAKYFKYDVAEAKKLIRASGRQSVETAWHHVAGTSYGLQYLQDSEILRNMIASSADFKVTDSPDDYNTFFGPNVVFAHKFDGIAWSITTAPIDPDEFMSGYYAAGGQYYKYEPEYPKDAQLESLIAAQRQEFDHKKRIGLVKDVQKHLSSKMYTFLRPGITKGLQLYQPYLKNAGTYISATASTSQQYWWLDKSKM